MPALISRTGSSWKSLISAASTEAQQRSLTELQPPAVVLSPSVTSTRNGSARRSIGFRSNGSGIIAQA